MYFESYCFVHVEVATSTETRDAELDAYVTQTVMETITTFFNSPFSEQCTAMQSRQPVFVRLLQGAFRIALAGSALANPFANTASTNPNASLWFTGTRRHNVERCIKTLSEVGTHFPLVLSCLLSSHALVRSRGPVALWYILCFI